VVTERFAHQQLTTEQLVSIDRLRAFCSTLETLISSVAPHPTRERTLALNRLEEASMWAIKAVSRG
jgi:hypothetical protein